MAGLGLIVHLDPIVVWEAISGPGQLPILEGREGKWKVSLNTARQAVFQATFHFASYPPQSFPYQLKNGAKAELFKERPIWNVMVGASSLMTGVEERFCPLHPTSNFRVGHLRPYYLWLSPSKLNQGISCRFNPKGNTSQS